MRSLTLTTLLVATVFGLVGPDTASRFMVVDPGCEVAVRSDPSVSPPLVLCDLTIDLPSPGYDLSQPVVHVDAEQGRIRIELRATPKPRREIWPAVVTPTKTTATIGHLRRGRYVVEIHYALREDPPLRPHHVFLLDALE